MEIKMLGTGGIFTETMSSFALIDEQVLFDCPNGAMKTLRRAGYDIRNIDICLITHFHGDHFFDIPFLLLEEGLLDERQTPFHIIGPQGLPS